MSQEGKRLGDDHLIPLQKDQVLCKSAREKLSQEMYGDSKAIPLLSYQS